MNKEEIQEAIKIIKQPIIVNSIEYKYFTQENYENLLKVYENCQQFVDFYEHFEYHLKILEEENQQLKNNRDKAIEEIDNLLIYDNLSDTTKGFGNVPEQLKFYLSDYDTLEEFRKGR